MSFTLFILGAMGIAGAIETGYGLKTSLIVFAIGTAGMLRLIIKEENEYKKHISDISTNNHSYPAGLESMRRRT